MAHAETCPVCGGKGVVSEQTCHGCGGRGWVEVGSDDHPVVPWGPNEPTITVGPWVYESGTYSANVEVFIGSRT